MLAKRYKSASRESFFVLVMYKCYTKKASFYTRFFSFVISYN